MNKKCPKCGRDSADCSSWTTYDGEFLQAFSCTTLERDALKARVEALEKAGDLMCKYYLVYGPESILAKEEWLKAKGHQ